MFAKVEVNGRSAHPVFRYLKNELPGVLGGRIKWNFTKFLIGRDGKPLKRFAPFTPRRKWKPRFLRRSKTECFGHSNDAGLSPTLF
jgi:glutathione peroxidase